MKGPAIGFRALSATLLLTAVARGAPAAGGARPQEDGGAGAAPVVIEGGRTNNVEAPLLVGAPLERAVQSELYAQAVAADRDERWAESAALYQQALAEWAEVQHHSPTPAMERAIYKADRERSRSQVLAGMQTQRDRLPPSVTRGMALERARIYRTKLMAVRAFTGAVPPALYARTRRELDEALRQVDPARVAARVEIRLLMCATRAAGGDRAAARLELAHVPSADRDDPANALALAACQAALGDLPSALTRLEAFVQRQPIEQRIDPFALRDVYLANDWDRLRGDPRFESLFAGVGRY